MDILTDENPSPLSLAIRRCQAILAALDPGAVFSWVSCKRGEFASFATPAGHFDPVGCFGVVMVDRGDVDSYRDIPAGGLKATAYSDGAFHVSLQVANRPGMGAVDLAKGKAV